MTQTSKQPVPVGYQKDLQDLRDELRRVGTLERSPVFRRFFHAHGDFYTRWGQWVLSRWPSTGHQVGDMVMIGMAKTAEAVGKWEPGRVSNSRCGARRGKVVTLLRFVRYQVGNEMQLSCRKALRWPPTGRIAQTCGDEDCVTCQERLEGAPTPPRSRTAKTLVPSAYATTATATGTLSEDGGGAVEMAAVTALSSEAAMAGVVGGRFSLGLTSSAWYGHTADMTLRMRDACVVEDRLPSELRFHVLSCLAQDMSVKDALEGADLSVYGIRDVEHGVKLVMNWANRLRQRNSLRGTR